MLAYRAAYCGLLPHPPIVVPEVGQERTAACAATLAACREFARRLVAARPARLFLVSPHSPRRRGPAFGLWQGASLAGDLADFHAPAARVSLPNDLELAAALRQTSATWDIPLQPLDHGAVVPLWFLQEAGWSGPTCIASLAYPGAADPGAFGTAAGAALARLPGAAAVVASGDMSHRCLPGAPAGFHPRAAVFDQAVVERAAAGRLAALADLDPELRELAAEDVIDSSLVAAGAIGFHAHGAEVLSYEHPFGVGYLVAVFHDGRNEHELALLPALAREAVAAALQRRAPAAVPPAAGALAQAAAVFVTIRRRGDGALRGCIGSLEPLHADLVAETADRARAAAFHDPRFPRVRAEELPELQFEVSVLGDCEEVADASALDPRCYGVVVRDAGGRCGVLLPDLPGIDQPGEQVEIARRKAGIAPGAPLRLQRFPVHKVTEP